jgi:hypothetical protein
VPSKVDTKRRAAYSMRWLIVACISEAMAGQ